MWGGVWREMGQESLFPTFSRLTVTRVSRHPPKCLASVCLTNSDRAASGLSLDKLRALVIYAVVARATNVGRERPPLQSLPRNLGYCRGGVM